MAGIGIIYRMRRYIIRITGKVQGVFFRKAAAETAYKLSLTGLARNEPDGSVYIEVEGEASALQEFLAWCQEGPAHAQVKTVQHTEHEAIGHEKFEII